MESVVCSMELWLWSMERGTWRRGGEEYPYVSAKAICTGQYDFLHVDISTKILKFY